MVRRMRISADDVGPMDAIVDLFIKKNHASAVVDGVYVIKYNSDVTQLSLCCVGSV